MGATDVAGVWRRCWLLLPALLAGCQTPPPPQPLSQDQAAAVLVSVTNVMPWSEVAAALQPNFALTGDQAVARVFPATQRITQQVLNAFGLGVAVGLPGTSTSTSIVHTDPATGAPTTTGTTTNTTAPGSAPTVSGALPGGASLPAAPTGADAAVDPLLQYQAALSLFESVQMMNREVAAAASLRCYVPFLVRLRLTVQTYRPNLDYTLHTRIGFFPWDDGATASPVAPAVKQEALSPPCDGTDAAGHGPIVVPLLAADDMERALVSQAAEVSRQIGFGLSGMLHGIGASASANKLDAALSARQGQDFNSRLSVAREADNTLYVRIGATDQGSVQQALVGQGYDIATLLLVPRQAFGKAGDPAQYAAVTYTDFRNAQTGVVLPHRPPAVFEQQVDAAIHDVLWTNTTALSNWDGLSQNKKDSATRDLISDVQSNNLQGFQNRLSKNSTLEALVKDDYWLSLWTRLSVVLADSPFKTTILQLRLPSAVDIPAQTAVIVDNGKDTATVALDGVAGTSVEHLTATLNWADRNVAGRLAIDPVQHVLTITFPSLVTLGVTAKQALWLAVTAAPCPAGQLCPAPTGRLPVRLSAVLAAKPAAAAGGAGGATPDLHLAAAETQIVADKGAGTASVSITDFKDDSARIVVSGAAVLAAADGTGAALPVVGNGVTIANTANADITFRLGNLVAGVPVKVTAEGRKAGTPTGTTAPVSLAVLNE